MHAERQRVAHKVNIPLRGTATVYVYFFFIFLPVAQKC